MITAAHCIQPDESAKVHLGIDVYGRFKIKRTVKAEKQFVHPAYKTGQFYNDIGEILLEI